MKPGTFLFLGKWMKAVQELGETGMGYTIVSIKLADGRRFNQVVIDSGCLSRVRGLPNVPFTENDIAAINQTDEK